MQRQQRTAWHKSQSCHLPNSHLEKSAEECIYHHTIQSPVNSGGSNLNDEVQLAFTWMTGSMAPDAIALFMLYKSAKAMQDFILPVNDEWLEVCRGM